MHTGRERTMNGSRRRRIDAIVTGLALVFLLAPTAAVAEGRIEVDPRIPPYRKVSGISGSLGSIGSDTMNNLMTLWGEGFARFYPNVRLQVEGKGSSTAPPALIAGTAQFGPMSRKMKGTEVDAFVRKFGYEPTAFGTSLDALAVYVNKDNPIRGLTLPQVDAIFSRTRAGGLEAIDTWGEAGLDGAWANRPIRLYGRNSASGTYGYFKKKALFGGDYRDTVKEQPGSASVVQGVTEDRYGIGYSGIGYRTSGVRAVPLAKRAGEPFREATPENVVSARYPLARFLYLYVNREPGRELDPLVREFIKFVFSREGQEVVVKDGYMPLSWDVIQKELRKLEG
jgi:phosphate transport system substrate-binding protein